MTPKERMESWLEGAVIGLNLCPFANAPYRSGRVRIIVSSNEEFDDCIRDFLNEVEHLVDHETTSTTVLAFSGALVDFYDFLDAVAAAEELLEDAQLDGTFQIATFHPDYVFAGTAPDDVTNWTNRAPYPTLHLIREAEVTEALERYTDPERIPETNMETMRKLGKEGLEALWASWHH